MFPYLTILSGSNMVYVSCTYQSSSDYELSSTFLRLSRSQKIPRLGLRETVVAFRETTGWPYLDEPKRVRMKIKAAAVNGPASATHGPDNTGTPSTTLDRGRYLQDTRKISMLHNRFVERSTFIMSKPNEIWQKIRCSCAARLPIKVQRVGALIQNLLISDGGASREGRDLIPMLIARPPCRLGLGRVREDVPGDYQDGQKCWLETGEDNVVRRSGIRMRTRSTYLAGGARDYGRMKVVVADTMCKDPAMF
ncbi:hypothetical protein EDB86DRAFT_2828541 [Lactarius hatsudake]|nr:hypothetical protein EDB86DRAFT_2828541 [Lactarius hatsudake]